MIEQRISYGHLFFENFLPGGVAILRNGACVLTVGTGSMQGRERMIPLTLLCDVALERFERWKEAGGEVEDGFYETVQSRQVAVRTPDVLYVSPYPPIHQCSSGKCGLVDPPVKGRREALVRMLAGRIRSRNGKPRLPCSNCGAPLRQLPFVQIHRCGHLAPMEVPRAARYVRVRFHDKGTFYRSSWTDFETGQNLGSAFQGFCSECMVAEERDDKDTKGVAMAATRVRGGRGESFYPQLASFIAFSQETTRILTTFRADRSVAPDLGRAILCRLLDLQDAHEMRTNLDLAANKFAAEVKTDMLEIERGKLEESIELLRGMPEPEVKKAVGRLEQRLRAMAPKPARSSGLFSAADKFVADISVLTQLGSHQRAAEAALIRDEFTELAQNTNLADTDLSRQLLAADQQSLLRDLYGVREVRHIQDVDTVIAAIGFSRQAAWPNGKQSSGVLKLKAFADEVDPTLIGKVPIFAAPLRTEAILVGLDQCAVYKWSLENLPWPHPEERAAMSDPRRAHAAILRAAPALACTPTEIRHLAFQHPESLSLRVALHLLGLQHSFTHCLLRTARSGSGYDMTSLTEYQFPADLSALIPVGSRKSFTMGGLWTLFKFNLKSWFDQAATASLRCILDPQCSQQRGASCNACLQIPLGCETFNHGISRSYLVGGDVPDLDGGQLYIRRGFWA